MGRFHSYPFVAFEPFVDPWFQACPAASIGAENQASTEWDTNRTNGREWHELAMGCFHACAFVALERFVDPWFLPCPVLGSRCGAGEWPTGPGYIRKR